MTTPKPTPGITRVQSFQTADGKLHTAKTDALTHQLGIDIRGLIQSNHLGKIASITPTDVSVFIAKHATEIHTMLGKHKENMRRAG